MGAVSVGGMGAKPAIKKNFFNFYFKQKKFLKIVCFSISQFVKKNRQIQSIYKLTKIFRQFTNWLVWQIVANIYIVVNNSVSISFKS